MKSWFQGKTEVCEEHSPECQFVPKKSHINVLGMNPGHCSWKLAATHLTYGMAVDEGFCFIIWNVLLYALV
jgi:hypothetical protein